MTASAKQCAARVLEVVPLVMRVLRAHGWNQSRPDLSMPQFRALAFVGRNEHAMLVDVAAFLGLTPSAASKLVDGLVTGGLVTRETGATDRRRISLGLTAAGRRIYLRAVKAAETCLAEHLARLSPAVRGEVRQSMEALRTVFDDSPEVRGPATRKSGAKP